MAAASVVKINVVTSGLRRARRQATSQKRAGRAAIGSPCASVPDRRPVPRRWRTAATGLCPSTSSRLCRDRAAPPGSLPKAAEAGVFTTRSQRRQRCFCRERRLAGELVVKDRAQAVHVRGGGNLLGACRLLRGHERGGADDVGRQSCALWSTRPARPKSATCGAPASSSRIFDGLNSR